MRAGRFSSGFFAIALGATLLACGVPFTSTSDGTGTTVGSGGGTSASATTGGAGGTGVGGQSSSATTSVGGAGTGGAGGKMPGCVGPADCPGVDTECKMRACNGGVCGFSTPMASTPSQVWGDCQLRACDGEGNLVLATSPSDVYDDGNPCTTDTCSGSSPENKAAKGKPCGDGGSGVCNDTGVCVECMENGACPALKHNCIKGRCVPLHCVDNFQDAGETALDCGGQECPPCDDGLPCADGSDCASKVCDGQPGSCQPASCGDNTKNGSETDVDCGGKCAQQGKRCKPGQRCALPDDCKSFVCQAGFCQTPICTDGVKNGAETGVDCGGSCGPCLPGG